MAATREARCKNLEACLPWRDGQNSKISSARSLDFKQNVAKETLCLDERKADGIEEDLKRIGLKGMTNGAASEPAKDGSAFDILRLLKAYTSRKELTKGSRLHAYLREHKSLGDNPYIGSTLVNMYAKCGALSEAQEVLKELAVRDVVTWNALLAGYAQQGQGKQALKCFDDMVDEGYTPTAITFTCVLKACGIIKAAAKGEEIHDEIISLGMLESDVVLGNALVDMYVKCGALAKAQRVLEELPIRDVVSWSALIAGYAQEGKGKEALRCYSDMLNEGHSPNAVTFVSVLKACGSIKAAAKGEEIHDKIVSLGMLEKNRVLGNALVGMYVKCGALTKAQKVLKELPIRDAVSWNALIAGYAQQGQGTKSLKCFDEMLHEGHFPDGVTFLCVLKACGSIGAVDKGKEIHDKIVSLGFLEKDIVLGTTLVDMYAKCGALTKAQQVLEELPFRDVVTWNALIAGYAQQGQCLEVLSCFERMEFSGVKPNSITLSSVLNACSHSGLFDQAETYFLGMTSKYGIHPNFEHYCCMTDLFSRGGKFSSALSVIAEMPSDKCFPSWVALLGACRKWGEVKIGGLAFERALHLDQRNAAAYGLMVDIYTTAGMQEELDRL